MASCMDAPLADDKTQSSDSPPSTQRDPQQLKAGAGSVRATSHSRDFYQARSQLSLARYNCQPTNFTNQSGLVFKIHNIVSTVHLHCQIDLTGITLRARNAEYHPKRFPAAIMRIRDPRTTALIFQSGKIVCTGAKSEEKSQLAARKYARIIQKLGFRVQFANYGVRNILCTVKVEFPIDLVALMNHEQHGRYAHYETDLFSGLFYRMLEPKVTIIIFVNGKLVFTGLNNRQDIMKAFDTIYPVLLMFKKQH